MQVFTDVHDPLKIQFLSGFGDLSSKSQSFVGRLCFRTHSQPSYEVGRLHNTDSRRDLHLNTTDILRKFGIDSREVC